MNVVIMAVGSTGDVFPFIGLGVGLKAAGHEVTVATQEIFADAVREQGLAYRSVPGDMKALLNGAPGAAWRNARSVLAAGNAQMHLATLIQDDLAVGVRAAATGADALLANYVAAGHAYMMSVSMGVPCMILEAFPGIPTAEFLPAMLGTRSYGRWGNRTLARLVERMKTPVDAGVADFQRSLGQPTTGLAGLRAQMLADQRLPFYHGYSPAIVRRPADWRPGMEVVGYWWPATTPGWQPPATLTDFLDAGDPPVFVGLGSMGAGEGERMSEVATEALRLAGVRGIIQAGWAELSSTGDDVLTIGDAPHEWLFPRTAAVVHHAGAGTTAAGLRAGVPAVPVPVLGDQPFWAHRLVRTGVSPGAVPMRGITAQRLADAITRAVRGPAYRTRAEAVARQVRADDGVARVVEALKLMESGEPLTVLH
ncbi:MAG: glycosyltransferase [Actinocatenispora sp.]